jgi:polyisoprenoid-binding protein YceI
MIRPVLLGLVLVGMAGGAAAQSSSDLPPGVYMGGKELADARAGSYAIDPDHSAVFARVQHIGYSWSVFRFDRVSGKLGWDPAAPEKSTLSVAVVVESITSNVKGFASELAGDNYLKAAKFPEATFVSSAFRRGDATHGKVEGNLTLLGITRPATFEVELIGAGKGWADKPRLGVHAVARINPTDFGLPAIFGKAIEIVVDTEFERTP